MKKIVILLLAFLMTGCSMNYNIKIDEQGNFEEKVEFVFQNKYMIDKSPEQFAKERIEANKDFAKQFGDYKATYEIDVDQTKIISTTTFEKEQALKYLFLKQIFNKVEYKIDGNIIYFKASEPLYDKIFGGEYSPDPNPLLDPTGIKINITTNNVIKKHNADKIDYKTNTYIWELTPTTKNKEIILNYDLNKKYEGSFMYYVGNYGIFGIIGVSGLLIAYFGIKVYSKYKERNKF